MAATSGGALRIWWQSFTSPEETRAYHDRLGGYLAGMARPGTAIEVRGLNPPSRRHPVTELRCAVDAVRNAVHAESEGYDAFVLGHFQDSGLWEARAAADIPVIGLGEAAMLHACTLGRKVALVTIAPIFIPVHEEQIKRYGLQHRVVEVAAVESTAAEYVQGSTDAGARRALLGKFMEAFRPLIARGIEVIVPAGGLPAALLAGEENLDLGGAVLVNSLAIALKAAEVAVELRRAGAFRVSRASTFERPSDAALRTLMS